MKPPTHSLLLTIALALLAALPTATAADPAEAAPAFEAILKVDAHSHMFEDHPAFHALFQRLNIQTVNICVNVGGKHLERMHETAFDLYRQHPQLYPVISTFSLQGCDEPGYTDKVNAWLGQTFERGALGVKIWKEIGLTLKRPDGSFRMPDDALWDPIYAYLAKSEKVLYAHLAEPLEAWLPLDKDSPHYHYYSRQKQFHFYGRPEIPSHESIMVARDRIMEKHPTLVVVGAHVGSLEHDLDALAKRMDRYPNFYTEVSARTKTLVRQPSEKVRAFLIKYQDRVLYGLDAGPDLKTVATKPREQLIEAIFDPNRAVEQRNAATQVTKKDKTLVVGQLASETPGNLTIRLPGGAEIVVLRSDIQEFKTLTTSIMPEGLESVLTAQDVADVLTFIGSN